MIHTASHGCNDRPAFSGKDLFQYPDPLLHDQTAVDIRTVKDQIPCRKKQHIPVKTAIIIVYFPGSQFTVRHNDPKRKIFSTAIDKMSLLGIDAALHLCHAFFLFQTFPYRLKFPQFFQGFCKSFHLSTFLL